MIEKMIDIMTLEQAITEMDSIIDAKINKLLDKKFDKTGGLITGNIDMLNHQIKNLKSDNSIGSIQLVGSDHHYHLYNTMSELGLTLTGGIAKDRNWIIDRIKSYDALDSSGFGAYDKNTTISNLVLYVTLPNNLTNIQIHPRKNIVELKISNHMFKIKGSGYGRCIITEYSNDSTVFADFLVRFGRIATSYQFIHIDNIDNNVNINFPSTNKIRIHII